MLLQFSVANFKSIGQRIAIDLRATGISELAYHQIEQGNERVLPVAAIMGANGSGKSALLEAFSTMRDTVINSFHYGCDALPGGGTPYEAPVGFAFGEPDEPTSFEVVVVDNHTHRVFTYGFTLDGAGVVEEWLNVKAKSARSSRTVFYRKREEEGATFTGFPATEQKYLAKALRPTMLLLSLGGVLNIGTCVEMYNWFATCAVINQSSLPDFRDLPEKNGHDELIEFLASFDASIIGIDIEQQGDVEVPPRITVIHQLQENGNLARFSLQNEGKGLQKLVALYPYMQKALHRGSLLIIDDLDVHLHPLAVRLFISCFSDPVSNPHHAQLVFTCHQSWLLASGALRRDEIWFVQKMENCESALYSLADFKDLDGTKVRKDEPWQKNYLVGMYGGIPTLRMPSLVAVHAVTDRAVPPDEG